MKRIFLSMVVSLALASGSVRADSREIDSVPVGNWPYSALSQLVERGEIDGMKPPFVANFMSRYEFAVVMVRWMDRQRQKSSLNVVGKSSKDIGCALGYEFAPEIMRIEGRGPVWKSPLKSKIDITSASEWFEVWWDTSFEEERIENIPRTFSPASFLRR